MATPTLQTNTPGSEAIIAGYFENGEDAHRAINALLDEGFLASHIGAAFHAGAPSGTAKAEPVTSSMREELGTTVTDRLVGSDVSQGGPSSDTTAVQPVGLAPGSGTPLYGAGKPGPISGSSLAHTGLPSELHSELAHDQPGTAQSPTFSTQPAVVEASAPKKGGWGDKLKHLFKSEDAAPAAAAQDQNFGTGQGTLDLGHPYSQTAFEHSIHSAGASREHSRHLSHRLATGGAVVTVSDAGRADEVETIFARHHGVVRFVSDPAEDARELGYEPRVEVFGHLEHRYPVL